MGTSVEFLTRQGTAEDAEAILTVDLRAFRRKVDPERWATEVEAKRSVAHHYRVLEVDGLIVSVAQVSPHRLRLGRAAEVLKGDVGGVATLPEMQGRGYGQAIMRDAVEWMRAAGYDLSRLGGYAPFYARFGYVSMPRRHVLFPVGPVKAGATTIPAEKVCRLPADLPGTLRPYDAGRDVIRQGDLCELFNGERSGAFLRDREADTRIAANPPVADPDPLKVVYEVDGVMQGYALAHAAEPNPHVSLPSLTVGDIAIDPAYPEALTALIKHMLGEAHRRSLPQVMVRMPFDEALFAILRKERIEFRPVEQHEGLASNMMQVLNLESLLIKIAGELTSRLHDSGIGPLLEASHPTLKFGISCGGQQVGLLIRDGLVRVASLDVPYTQLALDQATFIKLVFGLLSFEEIDLEWKDMMSPVTRAALTGMFPRQACYGGYTLG